MYALAEAARLANRTFKSLTLDCVTHHFLKCNGGSYYLGVEQLKPFFACLHRLRISLQANSPVGDDDDEASVIMDAEEVFDEGHLYSLLDAARHLRVLKTGFYLTVRDSSDEDVAINLRYVYRDLKFPHSYELSRSDVFTTEEYIVALRLRHRTTRRRLSLCYILGDYGCWTSVIRRIGGQFPDLQTVRLSGYLWSMEHVYRAETFYFDALGLESLEPRREAAEHFILSGRRMPHLDALSDHQDWEWAGNPVEEIAEYSHELPAPDPPPKYDWPEDDPIWKYGFDAFDERFQSCQ